MECSQGKTSLGMMLPTSSDIPGLTSEKRTRKVADRTETMQCEETLGKDGLFWKDQILRNRTSTGSESCFRRAPESNCY